MPRKPSKTVSLVSLQRAQQALLMRYDPLPDLTPAKLLQYHQQFRRGYLRSAALLWELIEEIDDKAKTVIPKRKKAVSRHGYELVISEGHEKDSRAQKHMDALKHFYENLVVCNALDLNERGGVPMLLRQMMDSVGKRYAVHEIVWSPSGSGITAELRFVPLYFFENISGRLRYLPHDAALYGEDMPAGEWMVTVGEGLMPATAVCYLYKRMPLRDWLIYCGKQGSPGIHASTDAAKGSEEWLALEEAVMNFGIDLGLVTSNAAKITAIDSARSGELPYPGLVDAMNRSIAALWRGGDLSTMSSGPDSVGSNLQSEESDILEQDDAQMLTDTLNEQLDRWVIRYMFGEEPLAWIRIKTGQREDIKQDIETDRFLSEQGFPMSAQALSARYNRPLPEDGDTLLVARTGTAQPPVVPLANALDRQAIDAAVQDALGEQAAILAPWLDKLDSLGRDQVLSELDWLDAVSRLVAELPTLLTPAAVTALAKPLEALLTSAVLGTMPGKQEEAG